MIERLIGGISPRAGVLLALFVALLATVPYVADGYQLSVVLLLLYFAFVGQAWNIMTGFAGQLSLGHTIYVGLGSYMSAVLFVKYGVSPWIGAWAAMAVGMAAGAIIGYLGFRFGIQGVYFALLTIAFAELTRILFEHFEWVGGMSGFFLPVANREVNDLWNLRGDTTMFYYVILALTFGLLALNRLLVRSRVGYYWLAIREDQEAAQAVGINVFRYKMIAVMFSAAVTSVGGVFIAFYYNNLFPDASFGMNKSIELIVAPIVGGLGTLFGPILGAFVLTPLGEILTWATEALGIRLPGVKLFVYGFLLLAIIKFQPAGLWPWLARRLGLDGKR